MLDEMGGDDDDDVLPVLGEKKERAERAERCIQTVNSRGVVGEERGEAKGERQAREMLVLEVGGDGWGGEQEHTTTDKTPMRGREEGSWEEGRGEGGGGGILYNMILFESSRDTRTGYPGYSGDGFDGERKEKTLVGKNKSVVSKLCVLSCMSLWCQALSISSFSRLQSALDSIWPVQLYFILFFLSSFLPYLTLLCCSTVSTL